MYDNNLPDWFNERLGKEKLNQKETDNLLAWARGEKPLNMGVYRKLRSAQIVYSPPQPGRQSETQKKDKATWTPEDRASGKTSGEQLFKQLQDEGVVASTPAAAPDPEPDRTGFTPDPEPAPVSTGFVPDNPTPEPAPKPDATPAQTSDPTPDLAGSVRSLTDNQRKLLKGLATGNVDNYHAGTMNALRRRGLVDDSGRLTSDGLEAVKMVGGRVNANALVAESETSARIREKQEQRRALREIADDETTNQTAARGFTPDPEPTEQQKLRQVQDVVSRRRATRAGANLDAEPAKFQPALEQIQSYAMRYNLTLADAEAELVKRMERAADDAARQAVLPDAGTVDNPQSLPSTVPYGGSARPRGYEGGVSTPMSPLGKEEDDVERARRVPTAEGVTRGGRRGAATETAAIAEGLAPAPPMQVAANPEIVKAARQRGAGSTNYLNETGVDAFYQRFGSPRVPAAQVGEYERNIDTAERTGQLTPDEAATIRAAVEPINPMTTPGVAMRNERAGMARQLAAQAVDPEGEFRYSYPVNTLEGRILRSSLAEIDAFVPQARNLAASNSQYAGLLDVIDEAVALRLADQREQIDQLYMRGVYGDTEYQQLVSNLVRPSVSGNGMVTPEFRVDDSLLQYYRQSGTPETGATLADAVPPIPAMAPASTPTLVVNGNPVIGSQPTGQAGFRYRPFSISSVPDRPITGPSELLPIAGLAGLAAAGTLGSRVVQGASSPFPRPTPNLTVPTPTPLTSSVPYGPPAPTPELVVPRNAGGPRVATRPTPMARVAAAVEPTVAPAARQTVAGMGTVYGPPSPVSQGLPAAKPVPQAIPVREPVPAVQSGLGQRVLATANGVPDVPTPTPSPTPRPAFTPTPTPTSTPTPTPTVSAPTRSSGLYGPPGVVSNPSPRPSGLYNLSGLDVPVGGSAAPRPAVQGRAAFPYVDGSVRYSNVGGLTYGPGRVEYEAAVRAGQPRLALPAGSPNVLDDLLLGGFDDTVSGGGSGIGGGGTGGGGGGGGGGGDGGTPPGTPPDPEPSGMGSRNYGPGRAEYERILRSRRGFSMPGGELAKARRGPGVGPWKGFGRGLMTPASGVTAIGGFGAQLVGNRLNQQFSIDEEGFDSTDVGQGLQAGGQVLGIGGPLTAGLIGAGIVSGPVGWGLLAAGTLGAGLYSALQGKKTPSQKIEAVADSLGVDPNVRSQYLNVIDALRESDASDEEINQYTQNFISEMMNDNMGAASAPQMSPADQMALQREYFDTIQRINAESNRYSDLAYGQLGLDPNTMADQYAGTSNESLARMLAASRAVGAQYSAALSNQALQQPFADYYQYLQSQGGYGAAASSQASMLNMLNQQNGYSALANTGG